LYIHHVQAKAFPLPEINDGYSNGGNYQKRIKGSLESLERAKSATIPVTKYYHAINV